MLKIDQNGIRIHTKASEKYVDVVFHYAPDRKFSTSIPIEYRRTGTEIPDAEIPEYLKKVMVEVAPEKWQDWRTEQEAFWRQKPNAGTTKAFFDVLSKNFGWCCVTCDMPENPNWARRIQDLKEFGYTIATHTRRRCNKCKENTTQLILVPLKRGGVTGYETWSAELRNRIIKLLKSYDSYEAKFGKKEGLLPDHKFPEIRWDAETRRHNLEELTDEEILHDFQLMSNQRNQQKREICRKCFQTGERGMIYGINFFYSGEAIWDKKYPKQGKLAEDGCIGCAWYDIQKWRTELMKTLNK